MILMRIRMAVWDNNDVWVHSDLCETSENNEMRRSPTIKRGMIFDHNFAKLLLNSQRDIF